MKKIISFPSPLPDEDYRSLVFRHQIQTPYESHLHSRAELFGRSAKAMMVYPENLVRLDQHLGVGFDFLYKIINEHTFYPLLKPFLMKEQIDQSQQAMFQLGPSINPLVQTNGHLRRYISNQIRYCPTCLYEDFHEFGISYIHRVHQLKFLTNCHTHGTKLIITCPNCNVSLSNNSGSIMLTTPNCVNGHEIIGTEKKGSEDFQCLLVKEVIDLMNIDASLDNLYQRLLISAGSRGYIHFKGDFIYKNNLVHSFIKYYGEDNLGSIEMDIKKLLSVKFLTDMFQKKSIQRNIFFYILLMRFFGGSIKGFFNLNESYSVDLPFGTGPWRCINYICPDYYNKVIKHCSRKVHEWVTGTFTCPTCGLIYTRKGLPKEEDESQYSIETMGTLFIETAVKYYKDGYFIQQIAEYMHSNKNTVAKYLRPFRNKMRRDSKRVDIEEARRVIELGYREAAVSLQSKMDLFKLTILGAISSLGEQATRPMIRKYNKHRYDWLMKHEREWMERVLPKRKQMDKTLNLDTMDDELSKMVASSVRKCWENPPEKMIRIGTIFGLLPPKIYSRYKNHKDILPKTKQVVESGLETIDQYAIRRFPKVIEWFERSRYRTLSLRLVQCNHSVYRKLQSETMEYIRNEINKYMNSKGIDR